MTQPVISVEHLTKRYNLGVINTGTLSRDLNKWWASLRGKPDPYAIIGEVDHGNRQGDSILALDDVSFTVEQGEVLGIIGRNGAGKSTLLKILSQVTAPTSGVIKVKGRIGSLLEVGTGFHPELTGRENVYLNGAILGMRKDEVDRKFDEIVDFSGVEKFIDTPVKRYSSGMYVRLAFAVAAYLDPEILIIDEVLAVGDAEFQKKCLGKMGDVASEGRTVLFVSHNLSSVAELCNRGILIESGEIALDNTAQQVIQHYSMNLTGFKNIRNANRKYVVTNRAQITDFSFSTKNEKNPSVINYKESIVFDYQIQTKEEIAVSVTLQIKRFNNTILYFDNIRMDNEVLLLKQGINHVQLIVEPTFLSSGIYHVDISVGTSIELMDYISDICIISITNKDFDFPSEKVVYHVNHSWRINEKNNN